MNKYCDKKEKMCAETFKVCLLILYTDFLLNLRLDPDLSCLSILDIKGC